MKDIIKTWPSFMPEEKVRAIFRAKWTRFYFSLGRGRPREEIGNIWFTHRGRIVGYFPVESIRRNDGTLPKLRSLSNRLSEWQFKHDVWIAVCVPPCQWLSEEVFHESFRGWRYFDFESYRETIDAVLNLEGD